ncbi:HNH endonuclease signature motif containing protein [Amorphus sp. MBR-141]
MTIREPAPAPPKAKRRQPTEKQKLQIMARYCRCPGLPELNHECGKHLPSMHETQFDHMHARALDGPEDLDNFRPLCPDCHDIKTNGRKATTAGSDKHRIAKMKRLEAKRSPPSESRDHSIEGPAKPKRAWPKGRKLRGGGFQKRRVG